MEKLHIAVCDDDVTAREVISGSLKGVFAQHGVDAVLESYGSADALGADLCSKAFDLLLLDIDMPGTDGITFADHLRAEQNNIEIIYISNREDRVFDSLRSMPCGFIRKSRFLQDTAEIVNLYLKSVRPAADTPGWCCTARTAWNPCSWISLSMWRALENIRISW